MLLIVAFVLLLVLPSPWGLTAFLVGLVLFGIEVGLWNRTVRHKRPSVGAETLIGERGTAISTLVPDGQVRVGGTIWEARSLAPAQPGDAVRVVDRDELVLVVEPDPAG
jgi:membrane protein implicated in regulation of membrane protease activity